MKLTYPAGPYDANIATVKVELPKQLPSRLTTLQKACLAATFEANPAGCPAASIIGHAKATTPRDPGPVGRPGVLRLPRRRSVPEPDHRAAGLRRDRRPRRHDVHQQSGITSSTFKTVPDVPVGTFELTLPQGPYSALTAEAHLCKAKNLAMPTEFVGQNGAEINTSTKIAVTGCPKAKKTTHKQQKHKAKSKHKRKTKR